MTGTFVNKLTVDRDLFYGREGGKINSTVYFLKYTGNDLMRKDTRKLMQVIYRNFEELSQMRELNHTKEEINRLLSSSDSIVIIGMLNDHIISYLIAEITLFNNRQYMHIYYLYTVPIHRGNGIATYMLNLIHRYAKDEMVDALSLTYDTYDKALTKFYLSNYFNYDQQMRSFQRHDMLVKEI
jgi:RimJ/RimL family protein N-acetyltransferase